MVGCCLWQLKEEVVVSVPAEHWTVVYDVVSGFAAVGCDYKIVV